MFIQQLGAIEADGKEVVFPTQIIERLLKRPNHGVDTVQVVFKLDEQSPGSVIGPGPDSPTGMIERSLIIVSHIAVLQA